MQHQQRRQCNLGLTTYVTVNGSVEHQQIKSLSYPIYAIVYLVDISATRSLNTIAVYSLVYVFERDLFIVYKSHG